MEERKKHEVSGSPGEEVRLAAGKLTLLTKLRCNRHSQGWGVAKPGWIDKNGSERRSGFISDREYCQTGGKTAVGWQGGEGDGRRKGVRSSLGQRDDNGPPGRKKSVQGVEKVKRTLLKSPELDHSIQTRGGKDHEKK